MATARNIVARIKKLETTHRRPDEMLLVWRKPDSDVAAAVVGSDYAAGDKVICAEWLGDGEMPSPRWYGDRLLYQLPPPQHDNIIVALERLDSAGHRDPGFAPVPNTPDHRLPELTDNELLYACLGVRT